MAEITAGMVKDLRERTGAGMMDCKKALQETSGDMEKAVDYLRAKGLSNAAKKADRATSEGLVALWNENNKASMVELNCETDFVSNNEKFVELANKVLNLQKINYASSAEELLTKEIEGKSLEDFIKGNIAVIGENIRLNRAISLSVDKGIVASYIHNKVSDNTGKIGILVALKSEAAQDKLNEIGRQLAMHIAASKPQSLTTGELDPALIEKEKEIFKEQARQSGKPDSIIEKMVEGRVRKFYEEVVLLEQNFIMDNKTKIKDFLTAKSKELNTNIEITQFIRFELGQN